jgi:hypothetical protein
MNDLIQLFRNFIYRDLAFLLGGSVVIGSILYALHKCLSVHLVGTLQDKPYLLFLLALLAYVVGYAVQDFGAFFLFRPTFTGYVFEPNRFWKFLYRRFTGSSWTALTFAHGPQDALQFTIHMDRLGIPKATLRKLERILSLKVISMCVGGCSALSALFLFVTLMCNFAAVNVVAAILFLILGGALISLGWVKALQEMQFYEAMKAENYPEIKDRTPNQGNFP